MDALVDLWCVDEEEDGISAELPREFDPNDLCGGWGFVEAGLETLEEVFGIDDVDRELEEAAGLLDSVISVKR